MARALLVDRLRHILEATDRIELQTANKSFEDYRADWVTRDVVERELSASPKPPGICPTISGQVPRTSRGAW